MNRKTRKMINPCFGTGEFNKDNSICKKCQHYKSCEKEQRTNYEPLYPPFNPRWANIRKKYRVTPLK